jgi:hypothetical protein
MATQIRSTWLPTDAQAMDDAGIVNAEEGGYVIGQIVMDKRYENAHLSAHLNAYDNSMFNPDYGVPDEGEVDFEVASTYTW